MMQVALAAALAGAALTCRAYRRRHVRSPPASPSANITAVEQLFVIPVSVGSPACFRA
jgi:hypothetical protein